jgi:hypothetical protein
MGELERLRNRLAVQRATFKSRIENVSSNHVSILFSILIYCPRKDNMFVKLNFTLVSHCIQSQSNRDGYISGGEHPNTNSNDCGEFDVPPHRTSV